MSLKQVSPDQVVLWEWGWFHLNLTMAWTWAVMALMVLGSILITRNLSTGPKVSRWQNILEVVVLYMRDQIQDIAQEQRRGYLPFVGTLFLFIAVSNLLDLVPGYTAPTASLSTTAGLAICVFVAVPLYGIASRGIRGYLRLYVTPSPVMLPMNVLGELSRTLALAVRLFGNIMSGGKIVAILMAIAPFIFPVIMKLLGLLTGMIQAYIFAVLAMVYIAGATKARQEKEREKQGEGA
jgi:F-type H+-transporting ATPase subunit a